MTGIQVIVLQSVSKTYPGERQGNPALDTIDLKIDKNGKKDKAKAQRQKTAKQAKTAKRKRDKQQSMTS